MRFHLRAAPLDSRKAILARKNDGFWYRRRREGLSYCNSE